MISDTHIYVLPLALALSVVHNKKLISDRTFRQQDLWVLGDCHINVKGLEDLSGMLGFEWVLHQDQGSVPRQWLVFPELYITLSPRIRKHS